MSGRLYTGASGFSYPSWKGDFYPADAKPEHFLRLYAEENDKEIRGFSDSARKALSNHPWPGNVRELQNIIEQAVVLCEKEEIDLSDLPLAHATSDEEPVRLMIPGVTLAELERYAIMKTLDAVGGSPSKAASILGVSRRTIQYRMRQWGLGGPAAKDAPKRRRSVLGRSAPAATDARRPGLSAGRAQAVSTEGNVQVPSRISGRGR